jgi:hypothetical protein
MLSTKPLPNGGQYTQDILREAEGAGMKIEQGFWAKATDQAGFAFSHFSHTPR